MSLAFAALTGTGCTATANGKKQLPADVETLVAQWSATVTLKSGTTEKKTGSATTTRAKLSAGAWDIKELPVSDEFDLDVYGCSKDKKLVYAGRNNGLKIQEGTSQPAHIFLAPTGKLACTGSPTGQAKVSVARSLAGAAVLASGDAVVAGGVVNWKSSSGEGEGSQAIDYYDVRLGHFRPGPNLSVPRVLPHVHAIGKEGKPQVLVVGGALAVRRISSDGSKYVLQTLVPDKVETATPSVKAELVDLTPGASATKALSAAVDVGVGAYVLSSSIRLDKAILFVGGVSEAGQAMDKATRLNNPEDIVAGGTGKTDSFKLNALRVRPALLSFSDGTVVIWGGALLPGGKAPTADAVGELLLLATGTLVSEKLAITGNPALVDDPNLSTIAPLVVPVARTADVLTFLVAGGMPVKSPTNALAAPTYLVTVTKSSKTAELRSVSLPGDLKLKAGLFGVGIALDGRRALVGGGLVSLAANPEVISLCPKASPNSSEDCVMSDAWVVRVPDVLAGLDAPTPLELLHTLSFDGPRFGMATASLPLGALLAGGQSSTRSGDTAAVLDDLGSVLTVIPALGDAAAICK